MQTIARNNALLELTDPDEEQLEMLNEGGVYFITKVQLQRAP